MTRLYIDATAEPETFAPDPADLAVALDRAEMAWAMAEDHQEPESREIKRGLLTIFACIAIVAGIALLRLVG